MGIARLGKAAMSIIPIPTTISSFRDALGIALELSDEFAFAQAAAVVDPSDRCVDFAVFTEVGDGLVPSLGWLSTRASGHPPLSRVVLYSVRSVDGLIIAEIDLAEYRFAAVTIGRMGANLVDWIETDGEMVRSYAYLTTPQTQWAMDAMAEGAVDCTDW